MTIVTINMWHNEDLPPRERSDFPPLEPEKQSLPTTEEHAFFGFQDLASDYFQVYSYFDYFTMNTKTCHVSQDLISP